MDIAALVLGIVGLVIALVPPAFMVAMPLSLLAIGFGVFSWRTARGRGAPAGMAKAGLILGIIGFAIGATMYAACVACHRMAGEAGNYSLTHTCWNDGDCRAWGGGWCDHGSCKPCRDDRDCRGLESPRCADQRCVQCVSSADCKAPPLPGQKPWRVCSAEHSCVECATDGDCPAGHRCTDERHCE
jgi:Cys-rich repeat protein